MSPAPSPQLLAAPAAAFRLDAIHRFQAFGLTVESQVPLPIAVRASGDAVEGRGSPAPSPGPPHLRLELDPSARDGRDGDAIWVGAVEGRRVVLSRAGDGEHRLRYGEEAAFRFPPAGDLVLAWAADRDDLSWQRFAFDTALLVAAYLGGRELLHGAAVATPAGAVALLGPSGVGKTSVALELLARGHGLLTDDVISLDPALRPVAIAPGPPLLNVPAGAADRLAHRAAAIGRMGDEVWMAVADPASGPQQPAAIALLQRAPAAAPACAERIPATVLDLLAHGLGFGRDPERARRRFELVGDLAATVPVLRLSVPAGGAASAAAEAVEDALSRL